MSNAVKVGWIKERDGNLSVPSISVVMANGLRTAAMHSILAISLLCRIISLSEGLVVTEVRALPCGGLRAGVGVAGRIMTSHASLGVVGFGAGATLEP